MKSTLVKDCRLIQLDKKVGDKRGNITVVENQEQVPFDIKRVYYLYDVPSGKDRGGHAHLALQQLIVAASGSFDVTVDDGKEKKTFSLNRPNVGLYFPPGLWRELHNFSSGSVSLVLASHLYDEEDYIRDYNTFLRYKQ